MVQDNIDNRVNSLSFKTQIDGLGYLDVAGIAAFLDRVGMKPKQEIHDIKNLHSIHDVVKKASAGMEAGYDAKLKKALVIACQLVAEVNRTPDSLVPEDNDYKYSDLLKLDSLGKASFARIVKIRMSKE